VIETRSWSRRAYVHLALNAALVTISELLLKEGAIDAAAWDAMSWLAWTGISGLRSVWVLAGIACYLVSFANWLYVLRRVPLHIAYPVTNLSHALIPLAAWVVFGERFGTSRALGIALILAGTWFTARRVEPEESQQ
jgi:drug/metabolite transporter (DMT)-like permease